MRHTFLSIGLDFETRCDISIADVGLHRYMEHPSFQVLIAGIALVDQQGQYIANKVFDFVQDPDALTDFKSFMYRPQEDIGTVFGIDIEYVDFYAHNAPFERLALKKLGVMTQTIIDSAVIARNRGASSSLAQASRQLLASSYKMEEGSRLIQKFSIGSDPLTEVKDSDQQDWMLFSDYCVQDAYLSALIGSTYDSAYLQDQQEFDAITNDMNAIGWPVDMNMVQAMQIKYLSNIDTLTADFYDKFNLSPDFNLNSLPQLKAWCADRGVKVNSFNAEAIEDLYSRVVERHIRETDPDKRTKYKEVLELLELKKALGGSSLSKLEKIINSVSDDGRLRDQYMFGGAGQSMRTTGRGVQMQNLKRMSTVRDPEYIINMDFKMTNDELAESIRQVFTSSDPSGQLIVCDLSSIESRGLAFLAGADWKLDAFREGKDMYRVLAGKIYNIDPDTIDKHSPMRTFGKVGELSCGYGAGPGAVADFAKGMGVHLTDSEASQLVRDWRDTNPEIVNFWSNLDAGLEAAMDGNPVKVTIAGGFQIEMITADAVPALQEKHPGCRTLKVSVIDTNWESALTHTSPIVLERFFNGVYRRGRNICYYKPSSNKTGEPWSSFYRNPKTKQISFYNIYGGKLAGILTQSFCREMFFMMMKEVRNLCDQHHMDLIGQFHDEVIVDWTPQSTLTIEKAREQIKSLMSGHYRFPDIPVTSEVSSSYRYIK